MEKIILIYTMPEFQILKTLYNNYVKRPVGWKRLTDT